MLHSCLPIIIRMTAGFQNMIESDQVGLNISIRVRNRITDSRLSRQIYYNLRLVFGKNLLHQLPVRNRTLKKYPCAFRMGSCQGLNLFQPVFFYRDIIIVIHVVDANNLHRRSCTQKFQHQIGADKSSGTGN